ncbi:uncharacterized protein HD556DRAFT_1314826 [Suillus plorans]|uniref:Ribonuclease H1 N-terminal domain-containing protein n=1 Tax=Suillus plorans TaxID=116603 RepID=A0A9P7D9S0_9AGAM|nr:uncharacterized protein HD556DRAFT_1314826 [Suillus plorans]KAG1784754.1 hypothetical protein HD556DRAFT_1314826 [Suillus plorans]
MKVFPHFGEEQTFSLSELASAVELIRTQNAIMDAHHVGSETQLLSGRCPTCGTDIQIPSPPEDESPALSSPAPGVIVNPTLSATLTAISTIPAAQAPSTAPEVGSAASAGLPTSAPAAVGPNPPAAARLPTVSATQTALVPQTAPVHETAVVCATAAGTSSSRWYVVTVGRKTGVFQGWHNVHQHVIGVPGACFARHSSLAAAQAAYSEAVNDGGIMEVPL